MAARSSILTNRRRAVPRLIEVLLAGALVGAALVAIVLKRNPPEVKIERAYVPEFNEVRVPVPVRPVPIGVRVKDIKIKLVSYPKHQIPEGAITDLKGFEDELVRVALPAGLPIQPANLGRHVEIEGSLSSLIPPGMRAMTIKVDSAASVGGWTDAGSLVDVLVVERDRTAVIAEKVRVLSVEKQSSLTGDTVSIPKTVTILVTQDQCLGINTAIPLGKIALALRSVQDESNWSTTTYTAQALHEDAHVHKTDEPVAGYAAVKEKDGSTARSFALVSGKWIEAERSAGFPRPLIKEDK